MAATFKIEQQKDFTIMANHHLRNRKLSLKAKGLQSLMLSLPEDWDYTLRGLAAICGDGVDSISSALKELEDAGYIVRKRIRNAQGRLCGTEYIIYQIPQTASAESLEEEENKPKRENPVLVKADKIEQVQSKGKTKQEDKVEHSKSETEPAREKPVQVKPKQEKPAQEKRPQSKKQILNIQESSNQSIYHDNSENEVKSNPTDDGPIDEITEQCLKVCKNELSAKQIKLLLDLMSFIDEQQRLSYLQHIYTRLECQASKSGKKIASPFAYLTQMIKNDYT
ncbi:MAG: helix-turn-helix domain-containing protein, partial [Acutalibacteraceae bacterium]